MTWTNISFLLVTPLYIQAERHTLLITQFSVILHSKPLTGRTVVYVDKQTTIDQSFKAQGNYCTQFLGSLDTVSQLTVVLFLTWPQIRDHYNNCAPGELKTTTQPWRSKLIAFLFAPSHTSTFSFLILSLQVLWYLLIHFLYNVYHTRAIVHNWLLSTPTAPQI